MTERDRAADAHFGLIHAICGRFAGKGVEYEELFAAGCLGLSKAMERFDGSRGAQFSTYAFPVIAGEVKRLFRDGGTVRVSRSLRELSMKIARLNSESLNDSGKELTVSQLAEKMGESPERIADALTCSLAPVSLSGEDAQIDLPAPDIQDSITERLTLRAALQSLPEDDRRLIELRYYQGKTQAQTAALLGTTQVQISRREKRILAKLREKVES